MFRNLNYHTNWWYLEFGELTTIAGHSSENRSTKRQWRISEHWLSWLDSPLLWHQYPHSVTNAAPLLHCVMTAISFCDLPEDGTLLELRKNNMCGSLGRNYSVAYFECIIEFDTLLRWASAKGRTHMWYVNTSLSDVSVKCIWAPPSGNSAL